MNEQSTDPGLGLYRGGTGPLFDKIAALEEQLGRVTAELDALQKNPSPPVTVGIPGDVHRQGNPLTLTRARALELAATLLLALQAGGGADVL